MLTRRGDEGGRVWHRTWCVKSVGSPRSERGGKCARKYLHRPRRAGKDAQRWADSKSNGGSTPSTNMYRYRRSATATLIAYLVAGDAGRPATVTWRRHRAAGRQPGENRATSAGRHRAASGHKRHGWRATSVAATGGDCVAGLSANMAMAARAWWRRGCDVPPSYAAHGKQLAGAVSAQSTVLPLPRYLRLTSHAPPARSS